MTKNFLWYWFISNRRISLCDVISKYFILCKKKKGCYYKRVPCTIKAIYCLLARINFRLLVPRTNSIKFSTPDFKIPEQFMHLKWAHICFQIGNGEFGRPSIPNLNIIETRSSTSLIQNTRNKLPHFGIHSKLCMFSQNRIKKSRANISQMVIRFLGAVYYYMNVHHRFSSLS